MKYLLLIFLFAGCVMPAPKPPGYKQLDKIHVSGTESNVDLVIIEIDSCEYIMFNSYKEGGGITHKGNCKNHHP